VFIALFIQRAKRMCLIILSSLACPTLPYFSTISHERHNFRGGGGWRGDVIEHKICFDFSTTLSETFLTLITIQRDIIKRSAYFFTQSDRYSCRILMKLEFSGQILQKYSNIKFDENKSSGSRVVPCRRTDGWQTDMTKLMVIFRNFPNAPRKQPNSHLAVVGSFTT
jgi:hypothetical protein